MRRRGCGAHGRLFVIVLVRSRPDSSSGLDLPELPAPPARILRIFHSRLRSWRAPHEFLSCASLTSCPLTALHSYYARSALLYWRLFASPSMNRTSPLPQGCWRAVSRRTTIPLQQPCVRCWHSRTVPVQRQFSHPRHTRETNCSTVGALRNRATWHTRRLRWADSSVGVIGALRQGSGQGLRHAPEAHPGCAVVREPCSGFHGRRRRRYSGRFVEFQRSLRSGSSD
jgi:hypothetical protein